MVNSRITKIIVEVAFLLSSVFLVWFICKNLKPLFKSRSSPALTPTPIGLPPEKVPDFTGAVPETRSIPKNLEQYEFDVLVNHTPVIEPEFTITIDFVQDKLVVELQPPKNTNRAIFDSWLKANGYELITPDKIIFK